jgi:DNA-binding GntR family transcriptional regulator
VSGSATPEPLRRASVVDELADAIRARILSGDLEPGSPLREAELSQSYDVSRHTLRAALRALASEGLVDIVPNRGGTVARLEPDELPRLFELRAALELEACRLALERHGGVLPPSVHEALAALTGVCSTRGPDWRDVADAHARFHEAIVAGSESPRIEEAYRRLATELSLFIAQLRPVWPLRRMIDHHRSLVRDLEATGDLEYLRRHLADGLDAVTTSGRSIG